MPWMQVDFPYNDLPNLPPSGVLESVPVIKAASQANRFLGELKGYCHTLPNPELLLNTVVLQESRDSSAIENIVTTQDELYKAIINPIEFLESNTKEVICYREAMYTGWQLLKKNGLFTAKLSVQIMQAIKQTGAKYRTVPGTKLKNPTTGKIIYTPPDPQYIEPMLSQWERYINTAHEHTDPLIIMALMHYQFEAIHPFSDGNGRTGRILNVLYLMHNNLLTLPVLYHSKYIIQHKDDYYRNLRLVTELDEWESWIIYMLNAVRQTAEDTLILIKNIIALKNDNLNRLKALSQKIPAYELNELLFSFPYVKIKMLEEAGIAKRQAASQYLQKLAESGILRAKKIGKEMYYINVELMKILTTE